MKILLFIISAVALSVIPGCKKNKPASPSYRMQATVGGSLIFNEQCFLTPEYDNHIQIFASGITNLTRPTFPMIKIMIANWNYTTTTIDLDTSLSNSYAIYHASNLSSQMSQTGSITITSVSNVAVTGTFSFTCTDGRTVISKGAFMAER